MVIRMSRWGRSAGRGITLVEALVAMAVMAFGMLAVVGVQTTLRLNADISKQRAEATRLAERHIERLRGFVSVSAVAGSETGWDEIVTTADTAASLSNANTTYTIDQTVSTLSGSAQKMVSLVVRWRDRYGAEQTLTVRSIVAGAAPVLSGLLAVPPVRTSSTQRSNRHPTIPARAKDLADGTSVFKPRESGTSAWLFNNTTGVITSVCTVSAGSTSASLTSSDLTTCTTTTAQMLSGYVRFNLRGMPVLIDGESNKFVLKPIPGGTVAWMFRTLADRVYRNCQVAANHSTSYYANHGIDSDDCNSVNQAISPFDTSDGLNDALDASNSEDPRWPVLPLSMTPTLSSTDHSADPICVTDSPGASLLANQASQYSIEYFCIIYPNASITWSGALNITPEAFSDGGSATWTIGSGSSEYRVCRYTNASTDTTTNADHPKVYSNVSGNLINQNFLVIAGPKGCPSDSAADPSSGDFVNSNTLAHQP